MSDSMIAAFAVLVAAVLGAACWWLYRTRGQSVGTVRGRRQGEEIVPGRVRARVRRRLKGESEVVAVLVQFGSVGGIKSVELTPPQARSMATALEAALEQARTWK